MATGVIPFGKMGICISIVSWCKDIRVSILADSAVLS